MWLCEEASHIYLSPFDFLYGILFALIELLNFYVKSVNFFLLINLLFVYLYCFE